MNAFNQPLRKVFRVRSAQTSRPAVTLEPMESRVLMSTTLTATGPNGNLLPAEQRPTESVSLNYTKITYSYDLSGNR